MSHSERHSCRCCGYRTLESAPPGTHAVCPVCFWEDTPDDPAWEGWTGSNSVELREAQRNFLATGVCEPAYREAVRPPRSEEARPEGWRSLDEQAAEARERVLEQINKSFRGVSREGGVSLHETIAIDNYEGEETRRQQRLKDRDARWEDVPHEHLADVAGVGGICFFDPIGWQYYLPAYMTWWLTGGERSVSPAAGSLLYSLDMKPDREDSLDTYHASRLNALDRAQWQAVAAFLRYVERFGEEACDREIARKALKRLWHRRD